MHSPEERPPNGSDPGSATGNWENLGRSEGFRDRHQRLMAVFRALPLVLVGLALGVLLMVDAAGVVEVPGVWPLVLAAMLLGLALIDHWRAERALAFYGRFVRPGLRRLVEERPRMLAGDKLFRGRRTVILKVDMADYTKTTFEMPYGVRRLFVDLWFTLLDRVVARYVFLDKNLGDGSLYCFEGDLEGGSCRLALRAALHIRDRLAPQLDHTFDRQLRQKMEKEPALEAPARQWLERFEASAGHSFWDRRTTVRVALTAGFVDEGLWGLSSQSHYDVQGAPPILASRLEDQAENGEIVLDEAFLDQLERESPGLLDRERLGTRIEDLKGIGPTRIWVLPPDLNADDLAVP